MSLTKYFLSFAVLCAASMAAQAQVTPPTGAVSPQTSTSDSPVWYAMMSSHMSDADRQNRWMYYDGTNLATAKYANGLDGQDIDLTDYAWRLEADGGNVRLVHYDGLEVSVPSDATAEDGTAHTNTPLVMVEHGSQWSLNTSASTGNPQAAKDQWVLDYVDYANGSGPAYLNAMPGGANEYGITIYSGGPHQASGWFFVPLEIEEEGGGEEPQPVPDGWTLVASNTMSGTSESEVDKTGIITPGNNFVGIYSTSSSGAVLEGLKYCYGFYNTWNDYLYVTAEVPENGTYKFSFRIRAEGTNTNPSVPLTFRYGTDRSSSQLASDQYSITNSDVLPAQEYESWELELTAGQYVFGLESGQPADAVKTYCYVGDFKLYKKGSEVSTDTYTVTWQDAQGGTLDVKVGDEQAVSGQSYPAESDVTITPVADEGYELTSLMVNDEEMSDIVDLFGSVTITLEKDIVIAATFEATTPGPEPEPEPSLTAIEMTGVTSSSFNHQMFYFNETEYGRGASGDFYNGRSGNLTMSAWVNVHQAQGQLMGYSQTWYNADGVFRLYFEDGKLTLWNRMSNESHTACAGEPNNYIVSAAEALSLDEWVFVTVVFDTDNLKKYVYCNGQAVIEDEIANGGLGLLPDECVFYISNGRPYSTTPTLDLDEVQVWNRALSADEVKASMLEANPDDEGLIYLYRFGADNMDDNYKFANLAKGGTSTAGLYTGSVSTTTSEWSIPTSAIEPTFVEGHVVAAPQSYAVTWEAPENGTLTIMDGDAELTSGDTVAEGTVLTVIAAPAFGYQLKAVTVNGEPLEGTTFTVSGETTVAATFTHVQLDEWPHDTTGMAGDKPSVHPTESRYVTSATTTGADIDLNWTNNECPSTWYINTGAMMQAEQGTSFDLRMQASPDMIWCHAVIFVDWNGDKDFDDEGEMIAKVGLDHNDSGADGSFYLTGNPGMTDFTQTIEVPATATVGMTCIRVMYTDAWHNTTSGHSHSAMDAVDKGGIYDFYIDITEGEVVNLLTVDAEHATVRVRDYNTLEEYEPGTILETGTKLLVSATADAGYKVTSVTVNGEEWPSYESYTVDGPVHVVATTEALPMCTVNYSLTGEEYGSMTVYDVSGFSMTAIANGGSVERGGTVNVTVVMEDNVEGTITYNGVTEEFDSQTWEGTYIKRINITDDMETLDIAVTLTEAKAPENYYDFTYTIEGADLGEIVILDMATYEEVQSGASLGEGSRVGMQILYDEGLDLSITINGVEQDIADKVAVTEGTCVYYNEITIDQDIDMQIVLSDGSEPAGHTVTYAITGAAAAAGSIYVNDLDNRKSVASGSTVADGTSLQVQVIFDDQTVVGKLTINGETAGEFEYADNAGVYTYTIESVTTDIDIEVELNYGNGIGSSLADGVKVYPTVFDEAVTVEVPVDGVVAVYDMSGAAVYTTELFEGSNTLQLGNLADGHYMLRVEGAGEATTVRVVKK